MPRWLPLGLLLRFRGRGRGFALAAAHRRAPGNGRWAAGRRGAEAGVRRCGDGALGQHGHRL